MSIEIKKNKELILDIPEFTCDDNPLGTHLNKYEMLSHLNSFSFTAIIGKPGSGKTSLLVSFLTGKGDQKVFRKVFDHILLVMPNTSRQSMKKNPFKNLPEERTFEELNHDSINTIYNKLHEYSEEKEKTLLILDDVGAVLKNLELGKRLRQIIYNRRHLKVHIVILLQSFMSIPKEIRKLITNCFMFKPSKVEMENFCEELFETKKDMAIEIMKVAYENTKEHNYIMLNVESQKMYRKFDEIIVHEKDNNI
jgi:Poxvirus A32 protein